MYFVNHYVIQWERVKTVEDVVRILKVLDPRMDPGVRGVETIVDLCELQPKGDPVAVMD